MNTEVIHRYTRANALRDSVPIDVTATAKDAGFVYPVALTATVWAKGVVVPPGIVFQDDAGREWDVLTMLHFAAHGQGSGSAEVRFGIHVRNDN